MKLIKRISLLLLSLLFVLNGCTHGEFCNPELFAKRYSEISGTQIGVENYTGTETNSQKIYLFEAACVDGVKTVVRLFADFEGRLSQCRVIISKLDKNGKPILLTTASKEAFFECAKAAVCAFGGTEKEKALELLSKLFSVSKLGEKKTVEKTAEQGEQRFVYLSNEAVSELVIYNKWLCKARETEKPESRKAYDKTTNIRTQTVPHK